MIAPGDKAHAHHDALSTRVDFRGPPRNGPALRAVPLPGPSKQTSLAPDCSRARAAAPPPAIHQPKLIDRFREALRSRHYSRRTEQCYSHWVKRFIFFHHVRHPATMAEPEINAFLNHLAVKERVSAHPPRHKP